MSAARPQDLACRDLVELLTEFLEGALDERTRLAGRAAPGTLPRLHRVPPAVPRHHRCHAQAVRAGSAGAGEGAPCSMPSATGDTGADPPMRRLEVPRRRPGRSLRGAHLAGARPGWPRGLVALRRTGDLRLPRRRPALVDRAELWEVELEAPIRALETQVAAAGGRLVRRVTGLGRRHLRGVRRGLCRSRTRPRRRGAPPRRTGRGGAGARPGPQHARSSAGCPARFSGEARERVSLEPRRLRRRVLESCIRRDGRGGRQHRGERGGDRARRPVGLRSRTPVAGAVDRRARGCLEQLPVAAV